MIRDEFVVKHVEKRDVQLKDEVSSKLLEKQIPHVKTLVNSLSQINYAVDASEAGAGKSYSGAGVSMQLDLIPVVIVPNVSIKDSWTKAFKHFGITDFHLFTYQKLKNGSTEFVNKIFDEFGRVSYEWNIPSNYLVIADESHAAGNKLTKNSRMMEAAVDANVKILIASATLTEVHTRLYWVGLALGFFTKETYRKWCKKHKNNNEEIPDRINVVGVAGERARMAHAEKNRQLNEINTAKIYSLIFDSGKGSRIKKSNSKEDTIFMELLDMKNSELIISAYEKMQRELAALSIISQAYKKHHFAVTMAARQEIELLKVPTLIHKAITLYEEGKSVVIFVNYKNTAFAIERKLIQIANVSLVVGGQSMQERSESLENFNTDKSRFMISTRQSGGVGTNMHDTIGNFPRASLISPDYSGIGEFQTEGRISRSGNMTETEQYVLLCAGSLEERILEIAINKMKKIEILNNGKIVGETDLINIVKHAKEIK